MDTIKAQAVTLDVGGTLITPWPSVGTVYADVANQKGHGPFDPDQLDRGFQRAWATKKEFQYTEAHWQALVRDTFSGHLPPDAVDALFPAIYQRFEDPDVWRIHEDVLPTLDELAGRGFRLAVISNWDSRLLPLLERLKLLSFFETATVSIDIGFTKPSPVLFEHTLKRLGLPASAVVHVGDSPREDIDGAESAGITGILLRRKGSPTPNAIRKLTDLSQILQEAW